MSSVNHMSLCDTGRTLKASSRGCARTPLWPEMTVSLCLIISGCCKQKSSKVLSKSCITAVLMSDCEATIWVPIKAVKVQGDLTKLESVFFLPKSYRLHILKIWQKWWIFPLALRKCAPLPYLKPAVVWCRYITGPAVAGHSEMEQVRSSYRNAGRGTPSVWLETEKDHQV